NAARERTRRSDAKLHHPGLSGGNELLLGVVKNGWTVGAVSCGLYRRDHADHLESPTVSIVDHLTDGIVSDQVPGRLVQHDNRTGLVRVDGAEHPPGDRGEYDRL